jgi:hypothetical protein
MKEILPGIIHWTALHPGIKIQVSSYFLPEEGVLIDPILPPTGLDSFSPAPREILLTNRHHYRDSGPIAERYGAKVWCSEAGLHEFTKGEPVRPFHFDQELPGGLTALEVGAICPDETALYIPRGAGVIAVADGVVRHEDGPLSFVPDEYMGEDPEKVKTGIKESFGRLLERDFDHLLLAHGWPIVGGAKETLRGFIAS